MTKAWRGDMNLERDDDEVQVTIDWTLRGKFACEHCSRVCTTLGGIKSHMEAVHSVEAVAFRRKLKAEEKARVAAETAKRDEDRKAAEARKHRKVMLSTAEIDEIVAELESLIGMMEPYWSQGDADKDARALIDRLNAKADGLIPIPTEDRR